MDSKIFSISPIVLDSGMGLRRESPRPQDQRQADFDDRFDFDTLFYDVFRHPDHSGVLMIGPALYNLEFLFDDIRIVAGPSGETCNFRRFDHDRLTRVEIDAPAGTTEIVIRTSVGELRAKVSEPETACYKSLRVLYAISKNNDPTWICDWARYNRDVHGAQAVLIYDNQSTAYDIDELRRRVSEVQGIKFVGIVPFPFRFGPPGLGLRKNWDSNFLQIGSLEHARWRFLLDARSFLNTDIDELVVTRDGDSVFEAAERNGLVRFYGAWVPNIPAARDEHENANGVVRHLDFKAVENPVFRLSLPPYKNLCQPKWAVVPRKVPPKGHMTHHRIKNWWRSRLWSSNFLFRHFRGLSTGWKYQRDQHESFDPQRHRIDADLKAAFSHVDWHK
jgi:hypothetical protein